MSSSYKPTDHNTVSPYLIANVVDCNEGEVGGMNKRFALRRYPTMVPAGALQRFVNSRKVKRL